MSLNEEERLLPEWAEQMRQSILQLQANSALIPDDEEHKQLREVRQHMTAELERLESNIRRLAEKDGHEGGK